MTWVGNWWRQPDHFDWLAGYLQTRGFDVPVRRGLALVAASSMFVPANAIWGPEPLNRTVAIVIASMTGVAGLVLALLWLTRWPTRAESMVFAAITSVSVAAGCLWQTEPLVGLMAATALAVPGGYIAFFHTPRYLLVNLVVAAGVGAWGAYRVADAGEPLLALSGLFLVLELNIGVPVAIQIVVHSLGNDLLRSDRDPLTGLLNRRAFTAAVLGRLTADARDALLAVVLIDLDRFKTLNDSRGHAEGDAALIAVAEALTAASGDTALVCRMGGEEFLIADVVTEDALQEWAPRLCAAIASGPIPVTGSVGTAAVPRQKAGRGQEKEVFRRLVALADQAMYTAKRRGGNQTHHAEWV